jgi:hypothetical protein
LLPDEATLKQVESLGKIQCTTKEAAAVLGVTEKTFIEFLQRSEKARETFEFGKENGKASLRRAQLKLAMEGNPTMLIWLGKNLLGQKDMTQRVEIGKPGEFAELEDLSDADLADIARGSGGRAATPADGAARPSSVH